MEAMQYELNAGINQSAANAARLILPHFPLQLDHPLAPERAAAEHFIARCFFKAYGAQISHFLPYLLSAHIDFKICAAVGFQPAMHGKSLFLEHYLDRDIETELGVVARARVQRENVVEIGNLASGRQRATQTLFVLLADILQQVGYEWVVFTANRSVQRWLDSLNISTLMIKEADPRRLPDKGTLWGTYYDDRPVVLASNIQQSFGQLKQNRVIDFLRENYQARIADFVAELQQ
ncbi:thermostable hemolysin [Methylophaga sp. OBS4]|uniref:thermostable hemolysin n=1 Tax=Methylophaga sp. OBS4 TaxID=2991935 RepID=UPI00225538DA|nr:thermostable hemolysin [Methylophaga sp. OBS4]MCX4186841.1 thermostable hemolysin [Methylophaga sp. OBS4]